ncbi:hypothetical protein ACQ4PT_054438 [Festuca glaucescens]
MDPPLHNFGQFVKALNAKRTAAMLVDVHAAKVASSSFIITCPSAADVQAKGPSPINGTDSLNMVQEDADVENVVIEAGDEAMDVGVGEPSRVGSPERMVPPEPSSVVSPEPTHAASPEPSRAASPDTSRAPSPEPSRAASPDTSRAVSPMPSRAASPVPSRAVSLARNELPQPTIASPSKMPAGFWDDVPSFELFEARSEDAKLFASAPDSPNKSVSTATTATTRSSSVFVTPVRREDATQSIGPAGFIQISNFFVPYKKFLGVFKPRQYKDNQVMSLFVEKFNIENQMQVTRNKRLRKKFAFSVGMTSELIKDPNKFQSKDVIVEFKTACEKYKISKMDLLWFPIVHEKHWATCCINLLHSQINSFDSIKPTQKSGSMENAINNLITNFAALAQETQAFSIDIASLKHGGLTAYPQQPNLFDSGFLIILYMDKFDGKVMEMFDENGIPYFRMILASDFINHPMNTEDSAKVFDEETYE